MQPTHSLTVISLGGGVQSSVMALMASQGAFDAIPDCTIFADTHWEPPSLYTHLDWLAERLGFPVYVVDNGRSLREDAKALTNHSCNRGLHRSSPIPQGTCPYRRAERTERRHGTAAMHRALQDQASPSEGTGASSSQQGDKEYLRAPPSSCGWASPPTRPSA